MTSPSFTGAAAYQNFASASSGNSAALVLSAGNTAMLFIGIESTTAPVTVTGVMSAHLAWSKFHGVSNSGPKYITLEIWYAKNNTGSSTNEAATISVSSSSMTCDCWIDGVAGAYTSMFDSNASNPTDAAETGTNSYSDSITTSEAHDLIVAFMGNPSFNSGTLPGTPTGWTQLIRGGFFSYGIDYISVSSLQAPRTWAGTASVTDANNQGLLTVFAITADAAVVVHPFSRGYVFG